MVYGTEGGVCMLTCGPAISSEDIKVDNHLFLAVHTTERLAHQNSTKETNAESFGLICSGFDICITEISVSTLTQLRGDSILFLVFTVLKNYVPKIISLLL